MFWYNVALIVYLNVHTYLIEKFVQEEVNHSCILNNNGPLCE